jgi:hypothetical protein
VATFDGRADVDIDAEDDEDDDKEENKIQWRAVYPDGRGKSRAESRNSLDVATPVQVSS